MNVRKRILITGGSGFIGTNAVEYFKNRDFEVLNIDIKAPQNEAHRFCWVQNDILNAERLRSLFVEFNPNYLLHLAARTDLNEKTDIKGYAANIDGVRNTIEAAKACDDLRRIVFASSRMVCRIEYQPLHEQDYCPPNLYGESKVLTEQIVREAEMNCEWILVRPTSIWGPWFDIPYKLFFTAIEKRLYFDPSGFDTVKSFGFVGNTIFQLRKLFDAPVDMVNSRTFYLCDYPPLRVRDWADLIRRNMNLSPIPTFPYPLLKGVALMGDLLSSLGWERVPITSFRLSNLVTDMVYDTSLLQKICGALPFDLEEGVRQTVEWMQEAD
jgi:nucleoside-diphosphate-sugar epimerase